MKRFLGAVQFLTVVPVRGATSAPGEAAVFFPVIGAVLGAVAALLLPILGALLTLIILIAITGALHEDGLADVADALRAGRTRERMLAILKDSRIGTFGALALIAGFAIRWQSLAHLRTSPFALCGALALSRASMVLLAATTPAAGDGLGRAFMENITPGSAIIVVLIACAAAIPFAWLILATLVTTFIARRYFILRLGGVTGDCLGATCQLVESVNLLLLAWPPSF